MDNLTHSLVGAALGQTGLKRRTALALTTLVIGANLPDIDAVSYWTGGALGFRRGWTHGVLALAVLPFLLTGLVLAGDRWLRRRGRRAAAPPAAPREVLLLAFLAILTHPFLDWLNTYGVRWLMPLRDVWYYGDAWNIIDPWVWLVLGAGVWLSARRGARGRPTGQADRPARLALGLVALYVLFMLATSAAGRLTVAKALAMPNRTTTADLMVAPGFWNPLERAVVAREADGYHLGALHLLPWRLEMRPGALTVGAEDPAARAAAATAAGREFLRWARFPYFRVKHSAGWTAVMIADARYGAEGWASTVVLLPAR